MQGSDFRGAHQEHLLGIANDFQRVALQVAREIDAYYIVIAQPELVQIVNLRRFDAHVRVHRPGMQHIQFGYLGDQLLPQVFVHLLEVVHRMHDRVLVPDLEQKAQNPGAEIEIGKQDTSSSDARHRAAQVQRHRRRAGTSFGWQKGIDSPLGSVDRRLQLYQGLNVPKRLHQCAELEGFGHQLAHAGTHDFAESCGVANAMIRDKLDIFGLREDCRDYFPRGLDLLETDKDYFRRVRPQSSYQLTFFRIARQNPADRHFIGQRANRLLQLLRLLGVRTDDDRP